MINNLLSAGAVRLISSSLALITDPGAPAGRLEIFHNGVWGTVCARSFDVTDADIICKQLGYSRADRYGTVGTLG